MLTGYQGDAIDLWHLSVTREGNVDGVRDLRCHLMMGQS